MLFQSRQFGQDNGPRLLVIAGVHGDEYEPMLALQKLARQIATLEIQGQITVIPVVNESAFYRGHRVGDDDKDLARTMPGSFDGSITERVAAKLAPLIEASDFLIDLHTGGRLFAIKPLAGYVLHQNSEILNRQRQMAKAFGCPVVWGTDPKLNGRTLSVARDANVPAIYVEATGGPTFQPAAVDLCVQGCLSVAAELGLIRSEISVPPVEIMVEDPRDQSGFMQRMLPSPVDGFFEPTIRLGDECVAGTVVGRIANTFGEPLAEITASENGILLFQRAVPHVKAGESTGGLLATDCRHAEFGRT